MTTFKVYFICSAPKPVGVLEREIVIYSEVHLITLWRREERSGRRVNRRWRESERDSAESLSHLKAVITSFFL